MNKLINSKIINYTYDGRPTFGFYNSNKQVRACGIVLSYMDKYGPSYLIRKEWKHSKVLYCDIGGKTDPRDKCLLDTLMREVLEETNFKLFGNHSYKKCHRILFDFLNNSKLEFYYVSKSKYLIVKIISDYRSLPRYLKYFRKLPMKRFGKIEKTTGMKHHFKWLRKVDKNMIHPRLYDMFDYVFY